MKTLFLTFFFSLIGSYGHALIQEAAKVHEVAVGESLLKKYTFRNNSDDSVTYKITCQDYSHKCDGSTEYLPTNTMARSNGSWIELSNNLITVPPHESKEFFFKVNVPNDPSLSGSFWSIFLITPVENKVMEEEEGLGIRTVMRFGRVFVTQIGEQVPEVSLSSIELEEREGELFLALDVENTGGTYYSPTSVMKIFDADAKMVQEVSKGKETVLPTNSVHLVYPIQKLAAGKYTAFIILKDAHGKMFGTRRTLSIDD